MLGALFVALCTFGGFLKEWLFLADICDQGVVESTNPIDRVYFLDCSADRDEMKYIAEGIPVTLIHVGKTAGGSSSNTLQQIFSDFRSVHLRAATPEDLKERHIIITIRDPLARFASAYKWSKHRWQMVNGKGLIVHELILYGHWNRKKSHWNRMLETAKKFFDCFPTLSSLGEHCLEDTPCTRLLHDELLPDNATYHMEMGIQYFLKDVNLDDYVDEHHKIHVIETVRLDVDFNRAVSNILGIRVNITLPRDHSFYFEKGDFIPELREEYRTYHDLRKKYATRNYSIELL